MRDKVRELYDLMWPDKYGLGKCMVLFKSEIEGSYLINVSRPRHEIYVSFDAATRHPAISYLSEQMIGLGARIMRSLVHY